MSWPLATLLIFLGLYAVVLYMFRAVRADREQVIRVEGLGLPEPTRHDESRDIRVR